jgi:hypothetical protein
MSAGLAALEWSLLVCEGGILLHTLLRYLVTFTGPTAKKEMKVGIGLPYLRRLLLATDGRVRTSMND